MGHHNAFISSGRKDTFGTRPSGSGLTLAVKRSLSTTGKRQTPRRCSGMSSRYASEEDLPLLPRPPDLARLDPLGVPTELPPAPAKTGELLDEARDRGLDEPRRERRDERCPRPPPSSSKAAAAARRSRSSFCLAPKRKERSSFSMRWPQVRLNDVSHAMARRRDPA
eukprot:CAMPEP_0176094316 /NCGR_PEP_ID=MMETSP0120_2-20121206/47263_1 /TAXON_ID=160619 /ORGANISM="Kryptoperidinium foliaceum, Strain CCMP 1326" /LENGTH=166 /DNA_ID=CAMNT_0017428259 /DNA_START=68 /DNA_END=564 /DNA_ORIENTATION=+